VAAEEPDIISMAVQPGRVDTDMQALIRAEGAEHMNKAQYDSFVNAFNTGELLKPEQPGNVIAALVASSPSKVNGKFLA
jgi:NAD(P)-dependent dehydrogenase (short-subunit alcohol dehydrogenase family)